MTIEELKAKKLELEQKISFVLKDFETETNIEVSSIEFSRCIKSNDFGIEEDYSYNVETKINL
jgi:hypothetical protein